ncbi:MAG: HlyC/CorC family transporter [Lachnospiraceae bacterium]|nr:HlyC/CorC family transporter [Lachnospiraceae bacterium]
METSFIFMIFLQVILIALNAFFACAEIAIISINDTRLAKLTAQGDKRAAKLSKLTSQPARFLATIQVAITLSGFLGSAFAADNFSDGLVTWLLDLGVPIPQKTLDTIAVVFITLVLSYFTLIFGELVPKRVAMRKAEPLALTMSSPISIIAKLFSPIVGFLTFSTNTVLRLMGIDPDAEDDEVSEEEIRMMVDVGSEKGVIDHEEKEFIQNVFEFDDITAGEIATHRTEVCLLWMEETMEEWQEIIYNSRHALYPICEDTADNIVGILNAREYFRLENRERDTVMRYAVKSPYFVPESVKADVLFRNMKKTHNTMAVVMDEYGGMSGIITMNDLVQQLVGDLGDDSSSENEPQPIEQLDSNTWKIHGSADLKDVAEALNISLPTEEYETFNGLIFDALGTIPDDGTTLEIETSGLTIKVTVIVEHQIETAIVALV